MNIDISKVVLENAPGNAKFTSPLIQKELLNILANKVRKKILEEIGEAKYCILVDEALDESSKEQMAIILRFVDCEGFLKEHFFAIVGVKKTSAETLKEEISKVLVQYNLHINNMRGQGYDSASNMRGSWNGLHALFVKECPQAYYVHCFAYRLQLALVATSKDVHDVWDFFSKLNTIVNFLVASAKRESEMKSTYQAEVASMIESENLETGRRANQMCSLQKPGATRWSSHYNSVRYLIALFKSTSKSLLEMMNSKVLKNNIRGEAKAVLKVLRNFEFVFILLLMDELLAITNILCQVLQWKSLDILNALELISFAKLRL